MKARNTVFLLTKTQFQSPQHRQRTDGKVCTGDPGAAQAEQSSPASQHCPPSTALPIFPLTFTNAHLYTTNWINPGIFNLRFNVSLHIFHRALGILGGGGMDSYSNFLEKHTTDYISGHAGLFAHILSRK